MSGLRFPLFIDLHGKTVVVAGGGNIALRRVRALQLFGPDILVVAPRILPELEALPCRLVHRFFDPEDARGAFLVLAATDDPEENACIRKQARQRGAWANNASCREDCDFYFPGLVTTDQMVVGVTGTGENHKALRQQLERIREVLK